jgi:hypothetical protein
MVFVEMFDYFYSKTFKEQNFVKANKESFEICRNNLVFNVESSKLINHSTSHVFNLPPLIGLYFKRVKSEKW